MSRIYELKEKEVINIRDGVRLGYVSDIEIDIKCGQIIKIIVQGPAKFCGMFGREKEYVIKWECIKRIGDDIIIIDVELKEVLKEIKN